MKYSDLGRFNWAGALQTATDIYAGRSPTGGANGSAPQVIQVQSPTPAARVQTRVIQAAQKVPWMWIGIGGAVLLGTVLFLRSRRGRR